MIKICLVAHTENFQANKEKLKWLVQAFKKLEGDLGKIKINWMLEQDDTKPFAIEVRGNNCGDVITKGKQFFKKLEEGGHELGVHIHFTKGWRVDFSYENQWRLIKNAKEEFVKAFGHEPKSFVGGWWHSDDNTLRVLKKLDFKIDASPMPLYRERRIKWLWGKIPLPNKVETCNWLDYSNRVPRIEHRILRVPNAVDPEVKKFSINKLISLDKIEKNFLESMKIYKNFLERKITIVSIPFHPHSIKNTKIIGAFFKECNKIEKLEFITLQELYQLIKK